MSSIENSIIECVKENDGLLVEKALRKMAMKPFKGQYPEKKQRKVEFVGALKELEAVIVI